MIKEFFIKIYKETIDSFIRPKIFFNDIKPEKGLKNPFLFLLVVSFLTMTFLTYYHVSLINELLLSLVKIYNTLGMPIELELIDLNFKSYIFFYFLFIATFIMVSFVWYYVTHLSVKIVGGKNGYDQTYKAMTYSLSADYLTLPAFIIWIIAFFWVLNGGSIFAKLLLGISTIAYLVPAFYRLYLRLIALELLQEITKFRAFIAAYVFAYAMVFAFIIIFDILLVIILVILSRSFGFEIPIFGLL